MPSVKDLRARERDVERQRKKLTREIERRAQTLRELQRKQEHARELRKYKRRRESELERAIRDAERRQLWTKRACIDECTTWLGLKLVLLTVASRSSWDAVVSSADRTSHADDCGDKLSQTELWWLYQNGQGAPANPPGTGTHEGICDDDFARVSRFEQGDKLPRWAWGLDLGDGAGFEREGRRLGFAVVRAYGNEPWHCNLTENPTDVLKRLKVV